MPHGMCPNKSMPDLYVVSEVYWVSRLYELLQAEKTLNMSPRDTARRGMLMGR